MNNLDIDLETKSRRDLKQFGAYLYFSDPEADVLLASFSINGGPVMRWRSGDPVPPAIVQHVADGGWITAHNASFERLAWTHILTPRYLWPLPRIAQFRCTAVTAAALGLPRNLEQLGPALQLSKLKDPAGDKLIKLFSIPNPKTGFFNDPILFTVEFKAFHDYCTRDVEVEGLADHAMPPISADEQALYTLDQIINDRGVGIDRESVGSAIRLAEKEAQALDTQMYNLTSGAVNACSQLKKLTAWIASRGVTLPSAQKADLDDLLLDQSLDPEVAHALDLRQQGAKISVKKLYAMRDRIGAEGRVRGAFLFYGASTGRWSSRGLQLHNMPRPRDIYDKAGLDVEVLMSVFRTEDPNFVRDLYGDELGRPLDLISDALRAFLVAGPGREFVQSDFSGIEGCVAAWFAGEQWKIDALREIAADPENRPDMYRRTAAGIMNMPVAEIPKKHPFRQGVGKVSELALGYQGGVSAFAKMARNTKGVDLRALFEPVWDAAPESRKEKALKSFERAQRRGDITTRLLSLEAWLACECIKLGWRETNSAITTAWSIMESAIIDAVRNPGQHCPALKCSYVVEGRYLWCTLPSGRRLAYRDPALMAQVWVKPLVDGVAQEAEVMDRDQAYVLARRRAVKIDKEAAPKAMVSGANAKGLMDRIALYGGLAFQNVVQSIARDLLVNGIRTAEARGYETVLHVHDEIVAEVPIGFGDVAEFSALICELPAWAAGLPLSADGWRGRRYRK